jgi:hypothetical protein
MSRRLALAAALVLASGPAWAGRDCEQQRPAPQAIERGMALAQATAAKLDASGAQVVVLARAGQDLSRYRLRWSHLGLAYKDNRGAAPVWRVVHKLNHCGTAHAAVYRQGLGEFFLDDPHRYDAAFAVLAPQAQQRLLPLLQDNARVDDWHEPRYNLVAYAWGTRYQQSNQWAIETLAGAMDAGATTRARAQAWLQLQGYEPHTLRLGALTRLGARVSKANVEFDDHPSHQRFADRIQTVTADSVFEWLAASGLGQTPVEVR